MSSISDRLIKVIDEKGWLALSSIYFDNAVALTMNTSSGRVAYSKSEGLVFWISNQDILDSANTENGLIHMDPSFMGHQTHLVVQDIECTQHFTMALYAKMNFYWDGQDAFPVPKIPTKDEIMAMEKDEATGLYPGTDTIVGIKERYTGEISTPNYRAEKSTILMYEDSQFTGKPTDKKLLEKKHLMTSVSLFDTPNFPTGSTQTVFASGVNIDAWKAFYDNQEKFATAIKEYTGISDIK